MGDHEIVEMRHPAASSDEDRAATVAALNAGLEESGIGRRPLVRNSLLGARRPARPAAPIVMLRDLGPLPGDKLDAHDLEAPACASSATSSARRSRSPTSRSATWSTPSRRRSSPPTRDGEPVIEGVDLQVAKSKAAVILLRMEPDDIIPGKGRENWSVDGIVCYSKICTHVGCPISLNERTTHHLLCPCHQSTFDLADSGKVIFGPAARPLPQLPLAVDDEGYLVAQSDFTEPVGPSFWERDSKDIGEQGEGSSDEHRHEQGRHQQRDARPPPRRKPSKVGAAATWADERLGLATAMKKNLRKVFPDHWSFMLGEIALWSFVVLLLTGVFLTLWFTPEHGRGRLRGLLQPAARHRDVGGLRLHPEDLLRRPRRPAHAADAPLGRDALRRRR